MDLDKLRELIEDDDLGLLTIKPKASAQVSADQRLASSFMEINDFVRKNGKEPTANKADIKEMMLFSRLVGFRTDPEKAEALKSLDEFQLLADVRAVQTIADVFKDDDLGILSDDAEKIFVLTNIPAPKEISNPPEYIARRKPCADFDKFEHLFKQCQIDLVTGKRNLSPFSQGTQTNKGDFFVLKGVLVYVADEYQRESQPGAEQGKLNDRLRCIFENGTESDMLRRSLAARLYEEEGQRVSESVDKLARVVSEISAEDRQTGFVYVLRSRSDKPEIRALKNLYKIGFSRGSVEERIKNAHQEPTYLMAHVSIVTIYQCYNLNPQKLESLLHTFFGKACLSIEVVDLNSQKCVPKEWFIAPLPVITRAVELLISGEIVRFRYNNEQQLIEPR